MLTQISIGQQVRIINYDHPHYGEFVNVRSVHADGQAAMGVLLRFPGRWTSFTIEQVCLASPSRPSLGPAFSTRPCDFSAELSKAINSKLPANSPLRSEPELPEVSRASHYS